MIDGAISAIALHEDAAADAASSGCSPPSQPQNVRAKVPFWLGNTRGQPRPRDPAAGRSGRTRRPEVKKKAVFGMSQSQEAGAVDILIDSARNNTDTSVRGESIFWLAQKAGSKAAAAITERIEQDPDTEVKKKARVRAEPAAEERRRAAADPAWRAPIRIPPCGSRRCSGSGQSKDPRALDFFAEILK